MAERGILIVVSGFSGAGKGTLMKKLLDTYDNYALSVSMTTRAPRAGETDGVEYFFTDKEHFEEVIAGNGLIEYASYCGNYYGTPKAYVEEMLNAGRDVVLEIEIQGALKVRERFPESLLLFVTPPGVEELERRLRARQTEDEDAIQRRLARAYEESQGMDAYDYIVVNDDLDACVGEIHNIVNAARKAPTRKAEFIKKIKEELEAFSKGAE
ncbi:MAG: guanylate kinase [Lachnoclostridium sp.]|nr:guanylate kinase [Lachnospira sp.]MCM1247046.1 guanylate kinase [Lachnoclostridium sp.]MCM1534802.1 guanylate kinase [Clostridium sp.]